MKISLSLLLLLLAMTGIVRADITSGLLARYQLDEASGNAVDSVGGFTGTNTNSVTATTGKIAGARSFVAASSQSFDCGDPAALRLSTFSVAAWVNCNTFTTVQAIVAKANGGGGTLRNYDLDIQSNGTVRFYFTRAASTFEGVDPSTSALSLHTWTHIVATFDGTTQRLYINAAAAGTHTPAGGPTTTSGNLAIGRMGTDSASFFDGAIDDVRIYNRALSATDVSDLYHQKDIVSLRSTYGGSRLGSRAK